MIDNAKIKPAHLQRAACIYVRQSTAAQVERNRESTQRQYRLVDRALSLGWAREQIMLIDEDQGRSGASTEGRTGFGKLTTAVGLRHVGIVFALEVSRMARNNADWYRLLDLCGMTDTLIADEDGLYHPGLFNDRLVLGLKGTMSEAELHVLRARLQGGIRNKAARGELYRGLPVGFIRGEQDGEILFHPDEAVRGAIRTIFESFAETGSVRQVWFWLRSQGLSFPLQSNRLPEIRWVTPTYHAIHSVLTSPVYAGTYVYGKTRREHYVDDTGRIKKRIRILPRSDWAVLLPNHHPGFIDWETYQSNQARIAKNTRPRAHQAGGAVREGAALLQGLATCGRCGRRLKVHYEGKTSSPGYHCPGSVLVNGRGSYCLRVGAGRIDHAVADSFLATVAPAGIEAAMAAETTLEDAHDAALKQWRLEVERARYQAERAERRYRAVEPENRLVARGLEAEWEKSLHDKTAAEAELARREQQRPRQLTAEERDKIRALGSDLNRVWSAPTTTDRDRKELLGALIEEVNVAIERKKFLARLTLRYRGGAITKLDVELRHQRIPPLRNDEATIDLVRRLAPHYTDAVIAGILNRQGKRSPRGERFNANKISSLRGYWKLPRFQREAASLDGELATVEKAAEILGIAPGTVHRWILDGFIIGEQLTPGAPWRIRMTDDLRSKFVEEERPGYLPMIEVTKRLGVTRQTVLQRVKRGELHAVHLARGKRKGLRIKVNDEHPGLFGPTP
ncbi:MAG TPA: recombinase family protein [Elusimicrobia bacterium]|nr:recombinase family protein [Elusimicrobiota bacterium]